MLFLTPFSWGGKPYRTTANQNTHKDILSGVLHFEGLVAFLKIPTFWWLSPLSHLSEFIMQVKKLTSSTISTRWANGIWIESENQCELPNVSKPQSGHMLCSVSVMRPNRSVGDRRKARRTRNETLFLLEPHSQRRRIFRRVFWSEERCVRWSKWWTGEMRKNNPGII